MSVDPHKGSAVHCSHCSDGHEDQRYPTLGSSGVDVQDEKTMEDLRLSLGIVDGNESVLVQKQRELLFKVFDKLGMLKDGELSDEEIREVSSLVKGSSAERPDMVSDELEELFENAQELETEVGSEQEALEDEVSSDEMEPEGDGERQEESPDEVGDDSNLRTRLEGMSKEERGQYRRDIRYSTSKNGNFDDFIANASDAELQEVVGESGSSEAGSSESGSGESGSGGSGSGGSSSGGSSSGGSSSGGSSSGGSSSGGLASEPNDFAGTGSGSTPELSGSGSAGSSLGAGDQTPGGKKIYSTPGAPDGHKVHRTGVSRHTLHGDGSELFQVDAQAGFRTGSSSTSRAEAYYAPSGGTGGKTFSADYKISDSEHVSIFQQKDNTGKGPSIRISVRNGKIEVAHSGGNPVKHDVLGDIKEGETFNLTVHDNGKGQSVITVTGEDGRTIGSGTFSNTRNGIDGNKQFRYGAYTQDGEKGEVSVLVGNVKIS